MKLVPGVVSALLLTGFAPQLCAQSVVLPVIVQDRAPADDLVARVTMAAGRNTVHGAELATRLQSHYGRFAPQVDPLVATRAQLEALVRAYVEAISDCGAVPSTTR
jgi:hypothetical protein